MNERVPEWKLNASSAEFSRLADAEWQAAVDLGPAHKLSADDRAYQQNCFERAADYHTRAVVMSARERDSAAKREAA